MNIYNNYEECSQIWRNEFNEFHLNILSSFSNININIQETEIWFLNKFLFYLWGTSINETHASVMDSEIELDKNFEMKFYSYSRTKFSPGIDDPFQALIIYRKGEYKDCLPELIKAYLTINFNINDFDYNTILRKGYANIIEDSYLTLDYQNFYDIYTECVKKHYPNFIKLIFPIFSYEPKDEY